MEINQIFREFIHVVQENPDYIIGLLNQEGKIVSCSLEEKLGEQIDRTNRGSDSRIYELVVADSHYGYLWINGPAQAIGVVGSILYDSLKTRIHYEINQSTAKESLSVDDQLIKELLKGDYSHDSYTKELMKKINFDPSIPRVSICIGNNQGFDKDEITGLKYKINDSSTIYSLVNSRQLLIFKSLPKKAGEVRFLTVINDFINELIEWGLADCYYAVGSVQSELKLYQVSYKHCVWLRETLPLQKDTPIYFGDHLFLYVTSTIPRDVTANLFDYYQRKAKEINVDEFISVVEELYFNDFSVKRTSESLFLHKNTLLYKIKRYEELFNLDIRGSFQGKIFIYYLANFLKNDQTRKQVGVGK